MNSLSFALDLAARMPTNSVFIVHGRNTLALTSLQLILERRGIHPKVLAEQVGRARNCSRSWKNCWPIVARDLFCLPRMMRADLCLCQTRLLISPGPDKM